MLVSREHGPDKMKLNTILETHLGYKPFISRANIFFTCNFINLEAWQAQQNRQQVEEVVISAQNNQNLQSDL